MNHAAGIVLLCLLLVAALPAFAAGEGKEGEFYVAPFFNYLTWKETGTSGERLVKESGPLYGLRSGLTVVPFRKGSGHSLVLSGKLDLFGGVVRYDGHQNLTNLPVSTDVDYFGARLVFDAAWALQVRRSAVGPFVGFAHRFWLRNLNNSSAVDGRGNQVPVSGASEYWNEISSRMGVRWSGIGVAPGWTLFAEGGAHYPLYTTNIVDTGYGSVTLEPKGFWSPFAEAGLRYNRLRFAVTYEEQRYGQSPLLISGPYYVHQPASSGEYLGFSAGYCFW